MKIKKRLDQWLVERNIAPSRELAQAWIMEGRVYLDEVKMTKVGKTLSQEEALRIQVEKPFPYVSRGALKLIHALESFALPSLENLTILDIGASTGGFTQVLLEHKAKRVYAVDVGIGQLHSSLRKHPQVVNMEKTHVKYLEPELFSSPLDFFTCDVSFISLKHIFPVVQRLHIESGIVLVKPQFEIGQLIENFDGLVLDEKMEKEALKLVESYAKESGYLFKDSTPSAIKGKKMGNQEYLVWVEKA